MDDMRTPIGYGREITTGASVDEQRKLLMAAGVQERRIYIDDKKNRATGLPERDKALRAIRKGETILVVCEPIMLAPKQPDFAATLIRIGELGGAVKFLTPAEIVEDPYQTARLLIAHRKRSAAQTRALTSAQARKMAKKRPRQKGPGWSAAERATNLKIWRNQDLRWQDACRAIGKCRSVCYAELGARDLMED